MGPLYGVKLITAPSEEPVSVAVAKGHVRVDHTDDDSLIERQITSAREYAEAFLNRALVTQTWDLYLPCFPASGVIRIPKPPLQSITSITYYDANNAQQTLSSSRYVVDIATEPGIVSLAYGSSWPSTYQRPYPVIVRFVAGYGAASAVPARIRDAILVDVANAYDNRGDLVVGAVSSELKRTVDALLWPFRIPEAA